MMGDIWDSKYTPYCLCFIACFLWLSFLFCFFFPLVTEKYKKFVLMQKQMFLTSELHVEHPFAGRNTQHSAFKLNANLVSILPRK